MRVLEILFLIVITVLPFMKRPLLRVLSKRYTVCFLLILTVLHLLIDGWRWQMFPAYIIMFILIWRINRIDFMKTVRSNFIRVFGYLLLVLILVVGWFLPQVLPVFSLPKPTGIYQVGSKWIHVKTDFDEVITKDPFDKRELMVKMWFPTDDISKGEREPYVDKANRLGFIRKYSMGILPSWTINYLDRVKTYVYEGVPIVQQKFPVLIFSPGYGSKSTGYYALLSELASHGYIIVNVSHTYESLGTTFPDGTHKFFDYDYQYEQDATSMEHILPIKEAFSKDISFQERHKIVREASKNYFVTHIVERWSKDLISVIGHLERLNNDGFFKARLDLDNIGTFGHSRGGGAAGQTALKDKRVKAAANIDGIQWGEMMDTIFQKPFLFLSADWPEDHENISAHSYVNKSTDYFYECKLLTSGHPNFMDIPLMIPMKSLAGTGTIDAEQGLKITNEVIVEFFNKHLKNDVNADPLIIKEKYKLLEMKVHKGDSIK